LFPTNRRNYGWDWQNPGRLNAWASFEYLDTELPGVPTELVSQYGVDSNRIIYAGHSMGGHGCWLMSTHYPDRALAVAPAAGW
jgi:predicted peptidase